MYFLARFTALAALSLVVLPLASAAADYEGPDGYGGNTRYEHEVRHDGYGNTSTTTVHTNDESTYVIIEAEDGTTEVVEGETVIVVQEPEPIAAAAEAPPEPLTVVVERPSCPPDGIWVDGHWSYSNGDYVWVDGHCVVQRVNYVFVHPRWDFYANVWWFVPGYYRPCGVFVGFGYYRPWAWYPPYYHPYYRTHRPVPVHRGVPRRPTTVRTAPRTPSRGLAPRRPGYAPRTPTMNRRPTTVGRTPSVDRLGPSRTRTVSRMPTRAASVNRVPATRAPSATRAPATRTATVTRTRPSVVRTSGRAQSASARTTVVDRPPGSVSRGSAVTRPGSGTALTRTAPAPRVRSSGMVTQPRPNRAPGSLSRGSAARPSRTTAVGRPGSSSRSSTTRPSISSPRSRSFGRSSFGMSRGSGSVSRPSFGGGGRSFGRPGGGGFGGARSVPTARGR